MKNNNHNKFVLQSIEKMVKNKRFHDALITYQNYLEEYPEDYFIYPHYANLLIRFGEFEEAEKVLNNISESEIVKSTQEYIEIIKLKLLCSYQKYDEALELVRKNLDLFDERNINVTELLIFLKKQLGLLHSGVDYTGYTYKISQIADYSDKYAINHIKKCYFSFDRDLYVHFEEEFPLKEIYYQLREMLPMKGRVYNGIIENAYIFKYDNNGRVNGRLVNYIRVDTLQGTNDILTMYPYKNKEGLSCVDLSPVVEEEVPKVKRLSQIEKFNNKYNL